MKRRTFTKPAVTAFPLLDTYDYDGPDPDDRPNQAGGNPGDVPCVACDGSVNEDADARRLVVDDGMDNVEGEIWFCGECWWEQQAVWDTTRPMGNFRREITEKVRDLHREKDRLLRLNKILEEYASERPGPYPTWPPCPSCGAEVQWENFGTLRRPGPKPGDEKWGWWIGCPREECDHSEWRASPSVGTGN
jgi:hypothetical protein